MSEPLHVVAFRRPTSGPPYRITVADRAASQPGATRVLLAVPDEKAPHGWRFFAERTHPLLGTTEAVEASRPTYADLMEALTRA